MYMQPVSLILVSWHWWEIFKHTKHIIIIHTRYSGKQAVQHTFSAANPDILADKECSWHGEESLAEPDGPARDMEEQQMSKKALAWRSYHCKASWSRLHMGITHLSHSRSLPLITFMGMQISCSVWVLVLEFMNYPKIIKGLEEYDTIS